MWSLRGSHGAHSCGHRLNNGISTSLANSLSLIKRIYGRVSVFVHSSEHSCTHRSKLLGYFCSDKCAVNNNAMLLFYLLHNLSLQKITITFWSRLPQLSLLLLFSPALYLLRSWSVLITLIVIWIWQLRWFLLCRLSHFLNLLMKRAIQRVTSQQLWATVSGKALKLAACGWSLWKDSELEYGWKIAVNNFLYYG